MIRSSSRSARPPSGSGPPRSWRSSASWRSPAGSAARAALCVGEGDGLGVDLQVQLRGEAGGAQEPQRVLLEAARADGAEHAAFEVDEAAEGIDRLPRRERHGDGADGEVTRRQVGLDRVAAEHRHVDLPAARGGDDAPGAELGGELEGVLAERPAERLGDGAGIAGDGEVEVGDRAAERRVADGPTGDPDALSPAQRGDRRRR